MKLNYRRTFLVGLAFFSICAFWQMYDNIIPLILDRTFGLGETVTGTLMALDNVLALLLLPIFGTLSDRVNTRLGKRTPFIVVGTILAVVFMLLIPVADQSQNFVLFVVALACVLLAMSSYRSPAVALMPDLTPKPLRSKANAVINLMGSVGGVYTLLMVKLLVKKEEHPDYMPLFLVVAAVMVLAVVVLIATIRENKLRSEVMGSEGEAGGAAGEQGDAGKRRDARGRRDTGERDGAESGRLPREVRRSLVFILASVVLWFAAYNAVTTAFSRYAFHVWGLTGGNFANCLLVATGAAMVSYIPIGIVSGKLGRKRTILVGIGLVTFSYFCGCLFQEFSGLINLVFAVTGIGWAAINVNSYPMVVEMSKNTDVGKYTGLYYTFSMAAQVVTPILSGFFLEHVSYRTLFPYAVIFSVASFCTMLSVKHGDAKPEKKESVLEHFDVDD